MTDQIKEEIYAGEALIAFVLRSGDYVKGLKFYSNDDDFLQVGTWNYDKGQKLRPHSHKVFERTALRTQELVFVKSGLVKSNVYDDDDNLIKELILHPGDIVVYLAGGHDFEILENNSQIFEVKNGPFLGVEKDKRDIIK